MSEVAVRKIDVGGSSFTERIRERAFHVFEQRRDNEGSALEDWLKAEKDFLPHDVNLVERDGTFELQLPAGDFEPGEVSVFVTPEDVTVEAAHSHTHERKDGEATVSETAEDSLFRFFSLPGAIDPGKVTARLSQGVLKITASKAA